MYQKCSAPRFRAPRPGLPSLSFIHREDVRSCHPGSSRLPLTLLRRKSTRKPSPTSSPHMHSHKAKCLSFHGVWSKKPKTCRCPSFFPAWRRGPWDDFTCGCGSGVCGWIVPTFDFDFNLVKTLLLRGGYFCLSVELEAPLRHVGTVFGRMVAVDSRGKGRIGSMAGCGPLLVQV